MKYLVINALKTDEFVEEFETKEEALKEAESSWESLTDSDKNRRVAFYVLESANPDEDADNHFDGEVIKRFK